MYVASLIILHFHTIDFSIHLSQGENGSLYNHYNFGRKTNYGSIVDCVYLSNQRYSTIIVLRYGGS